MGMFNNKINSLFKQFGLEMEEEWIVYENFFIIEKNKFFYLFNEKKDKIIASGKTIKDLKEKVNSIISGC